MSEHSFQGQTEASYLVPVFESLRRYDGLTAKRLAARAAQPLLRLPIVQNHAVQTGDKPADAALAVIIEQVMKLDAAADRVIADAILRLGIYLETYRSHSVSKRAIHHLGSGGLGDRRIALVQNWQVLHEALGEQPLSEPPGEHTLRSRMESEVFERLAAMLVNPRPIIEVSEPGEPIPISTAQTVDSAASGKVIVLGGAAIDHIWRLGSTPEVGTSAMAMSYTRAPGGKGLSQAVAAAHLDLDVSLIAAIASDDEGKEIESHLQREGVDTSLLKRIERSAARTPATGVFELPAGNSSAAVWRDGVELDISTIDAHAATLTSCDVLLLTFELPQSVLKHTLELVSTTSGHPVVIVTPGQPYADGQLLSPLLKQVDYLVGHMWELEGFAFSKKARLDPQLLSDDLLSLGLRSLCLLSDTGGGSIYERGKSPEQIPVPHSVLKESSVTRDSFCAALAARLIEDRTLTGNTIRWAAAAMASFTETYHQTPSYPLRATVDEMYRRITSREDS
ncbi:carbohydrate kinase family protein [Kribbella sp. NBC_00709]|uniref:carbohydrate kinase family protein n=1 Tax=Kribbella sp. NBC_00709 TaxID=2975972 RepID=UPI002E2B35CF|nr:carbohydrate kinase family protein [Kribbella sp. NBC_00709]